MYEEDTKKSGAANAAVIGYSAPAGSNAVLPPNPMPQTVGRMGQMLYNPGQQPTIGQANPEFYQPGAGAIPPPGDRTIRGEQTSGRWVMQGVLAAWVVFAIVTLILGTVNGFDSTIFQTCLLVAGIWGGILLILLCTVGC